MFPSTLGITPVTQLLKKDLDATKSKPRHLDLNGLYYLLKHEKYFISLMNFIWIGTGFVETLQIDPDHLNKGLLPLNEVVKKFLLQKKILFQRKQKTEVPLFWAVLIGLYLLYQNDLKRFL